MRWQCLCLLFKFQCSLFLKASLIKVFGEFCASFLAVQDSSIGDLVTESVSESCFDFRAEQSRAEYNNCNHYNIYKHYRDSDLDLDLN